MDSGAWQSDLDSRRFRGRRVLVSENEPAVRKLLHTFLTRDGYQVSEAVNGRQALELLRASPAGFDLALLAMPTIGGREVLQAVGLTLPILVLSGWGKFYHPDFLGAPFLAKPFTISDLLSTVAALLAARAPLED